MNQFAVLASQSRAKLAGKGMEMISIPTADAKKFAPGVPDTIMMTVGPRVRNKIPNYGGAVQTVSNALEGIFPAFQGGRNAVDDDVIKFFNGARISK